MVEAWDGWCNYGIAENPDIKFVVPERGQRPLGRHDGVLKTSKNKEAAHAFINYILDADDARLGDREHPLQGAQQGRHGAGRPRRSSSRLPATWA